MKKKLRAAVIGLGVGERHIGGYVGHPSCELVALCDLSPTRLAEVGRQYPGVRQTGRAEEILQADDVDIVSIASFDDVHFEQTMMALRSGKHVFVEKPMCQTLEQLAAIKAEWQRQGGRVALASNLIMRAAPLFEWLRGQIAAGALGEVYAYDSDYLFGRLHKITEGWRRDVDNYSVMQGGGIHLVDLMMWLTQQRPSSVVSAGNRCCSRGTAYRYDDFMSSMMWMDSGMVARITSNYGCVHRHHHVVRIFGTEATFIYDDAGPRLHETRDPERVARPLSLACKASSKADLIPGFLDRILAGEPMETFSQLFFDGMSVCVACDKSLASGQREQVAYV